MAFFTLPSLSDVMKIIRNTKAIAEEQMFAFVMYEMDKFYLISAVKLVKKSTKLALNHAAERGSKLVLITQQSSIIMYVE